MLRILRIDLEPHRVVLVLQGHIVGQWGDVLEQECFDLIRSGRRVALDLSGVVFIGHPSFRALGRLDRAGVGIIACTPLIADMLEQEGIEVSRECTETDKGEDPAKRGGPPDA